MANIASIGDTYNDWTLLGASKKKKDYWYCVCKCEAVKLVLVYNVISGKTKSCGCSWIRRNLCKLGEVFHTWKIVGLPVYRTVKQKIITFYDCECTKCGHVREINVHELHRAEIQITCNCQRRKNVVKTPEYRIWANIKYRCSTPTCHQYYLYGGRGIKICERWANSFSQFLEDMGPRPSKNHTIERNDVNGNYCPENCRWLLSSKQGENKRNSLRVLYKGKYLTIKQVSKLTNTTWNIVRKRYRNQIVNLSDVPAK